MVNNWCEIEVIGAYIALLPTIEVAHVRNIVLEFTLNFLANFSIDKVGVIG